LHGPVAADDFLLAVVAMLVRQRPQRRECLIRQVGDHDMLFRLRRDERPRFLGSERAEVAHGPRAGQPHCARLDSAQHQRLCGRAGVPGVERQASFEVVFSRPDPDRPRPRPAHQLDRLRNARQRLVLGARIRIVSLTISGYRTRLTQEGPVPAALALAGIHFGTLAGQNDNTLCRRAIVENVHIANCRFGIWSGNPEGKNTDHATILVTGCVFYNNAQAGILWGTGNAIVNVISCDVFGNGWAGNAFPADAYSGQIGANVHLQSGYMDIVSYTSAGKPATADIYQSSGRVSIINAWSDVFGYFFYQASASQNEGGYHNGQTNPAITGKAACTTTPPPTSSV
jgi:hypothetical protein